MKFPGGISVGAGITGPAVGAGTGAAGGKTGGGKPPGGGTCKPPGGGTCPAGTCAGGGTGVCKGPLQLGNQAVDRLGIDLRPIARRLLITHDIWVSKALEIVS